MSSAFDIQIGGTHYSEFAIQPTEYIMKNKLDFLTGNVIKYISRHKLKGGAQDLQKVIHYTQMLLEDTYGIKSKVTYSNEENPKKRKVKRVKKDKNELPVAQPAGTVPA